MGFHNLGWDLYMMEFDSNDTFCRKGDHHLLCFTLASFSFTYDTYVRFLYGWEHGVSVGLGWESRGCTSCMPWMELSYISWGGWSEDTRVWEACLADERIGKDSKEVSNGIISNTLLCCPRCCDHNYQVLSTASLDWCYFHIPPTEASLPWRQVEDTYLFCRLLPC
jgi:hypothetical protein